MPLPKDGEIQLFQVVDTDGNPARVSLIAGVYRLAVDALLVGPAGAYAQGDFDSTNVDEANALAMWVRAATTGLDTTQAVGSRNVPIAARAALAAQAYGLERLLTDGVIRVDDGTTYSAMAGRGAVAAQAYTLVRGLTDAVVRGDDGTTYSAVGARAATDWDSDAGTLAIPLLGVCAALYGRNFAGTALEIILADLASAISGRAASGIRGIDANALALGIDNTGAAVVRAIEARGAVAAQAYTLQRLFTDAVIRGDDGTTYSAVAARNADADADFAAALIGLTVNARMTAIRGSTSDWARLRCDEFATISGEAASLSIWLRTASALLGTDNTGAAVLRAVEARDYASAADVASALIGLLVNSRLACLSEETGNWEMLGSLAPVPSNDRSALYVVEPRESGWQSSALGRRFIATSQTAGATLTAQAAFVATTPTLMLRQAAGATETEVVRSISITSFALTPAGIRVVVMLDPDDRFSAGGTTVTPQNPNEGSAAASGITSFLENPTATAADADERIIYNEGFPGGVGAKLVLSFKDELILSGVGTLLVYVFDSAGAVAPTIAYNEEWEEYV